MTLSRRRRRHLHLFEQMENLLGGGSALSGMLNEGDAVRSGDTRGIREGVERGLNDFEFAEHGGRENVYPCALLDEVRGDFGVAHVGSAAERRFEITSTPIPA